MEIINSYNHFDSILAIYTKRHLEVELIVGEKKKKILRWDKKITKSQNLVKKKQGTRRKDEQQTFNETLNTYKTLKT